VIESSECSVDPSESIFWRDTVYWFIRGKLIFLWRELTSTHHQHPTTMSSDEDDNDDCVFDTVMTLCQSSSSDDSSDDDEVPVDIVPPPPLVRGGSRPGKAANIDRKRVFYSNLLYHDFWGPTPVYTPYYFKLFSSFQLNCLMSCWSV